MQLVPDVHNWWRWYSTHATAIGAALNAAAAAIAASTDAGALAGAVPIWQVFALAACLFIATFAGRVILQPALHTESDATGGERP